MRVLICDDEPDLRFLYRSVFERYGAAVDEAVDAAGCLASVAGQRPDLVVLDVTLPDRDGLTVLRDLRIRWPGLEVVMVSADLRPDLLDAAESLGAPGYDKLRFLDQIGRLAGGVA